MDLPLVSEESIEELQEELLQAIDASPETFAIDPHDESYGLAFQRYLLFSRWPQLVARAGIALSTEDVFYNSYYWMVRFSKLYQIKQGYDAGIEQQVFQMLEQADFQVDWDMIELLSKRAEADSISA